MPRILGSDLYRLALRTAARTGLHTIDLAGRPYLVGTDSEGRSRITLWLSRVQGLSHAAATTPDRGASATVRHFTAGQLLDDLLPRLAHGHTLICLNALPNEECEPARFARDLAALLGAPPARRANVRARSQPGLGAIAFDAFVADRLAPALKQRGLRKSGLSWYLRGGGVWGYVTLQKDADNRGDTCRFTVNVSVSSDRLRFFDGHADLAKRPRLGEWSGEQIRLGALLPGGGDRWWALGPGADAQGTEDEVESAILGPGLSFLRSLRTDEALRDRWLAQNLTTGSRAIHLGVLLHDLGPRERIPALLDSIRSDARSRRWDYAEILLHRIADQDRAAFSRAGS